MDRLYPLIALAVLVGCDDSGKKAKATPPASRVNAVVAKKPTAESADDFCDVVHPADGAPQFEYPALDGAEPSTAASGWRWVNVWATWCKPCIEEMPRLQKWRTELQGLGEVVFLSADDAAETVEAFRKTHPDTPSGPRMATPDDLQPWLTKLGLTSAPSLPVHVFVDGSNNVRCIRVSGVNDGDRASVESLLK